MLRNRLVMVLITLTANFCQVAQANDGLEANDQVFQLRLSKDIHILPKNSTLGYGFEISQDISEHFKLRTEYFSYQATMHRKQDQIAATASRLLRSNSLLLDWHPYSGTFRTSMGMMINNHSLSARGWYDGDLDINGQIQAIGHIINLKKGYLAEAYNLDTQQLATVSAKIRWPTFSPFLGVGWTNQKSRNTNLRFSVDLGLIYYGKPSVDLSMSGGLPEALEAYDQEAYRGYINDQEHSLSQKLNRYRVYPVISFGLAYLF